MHAYMSKHTCVFDVYACVNENACGIPSSIVKCMHVYEQVKFGGLKNLKKLVLQGMKMSDLHPSIGNLRILQHLSLQHNNLYDLPFTFEWLDQLEYLDVSGNLFTILPRAVYHLKGLKVLKGLNSCPLIVRSEWRRCRYRRWSSHHHCSNLTATPLQQPQTLKEAAFNSALGINCWRAGLPRKYCALLTESEMINKYDLCENCCKPILKVTPEQEPEG